MANQPQKVKKIPMRQCLGCNEHRPKKEMIRVVRSPEGEISIDLVGKKSGRGAYICPKRACFTRARRSKRIESNLEISIPEEIYDKMESELEEYERA